MPNLRVSTLTCLTTVAVLGAWSVPQSESEIAVWPGGSVATEAPTLFAPGVISTGLRERDGSLSAAGDCFAYTIEGPSVGVIVLVERNGDGWGTPEIAPFSGEFTDLEPAFDPRGGELWFASRRPIRADLAAGVSAAGDSNLWRVKYTRGKDGLEWGAPEDLEGLNTDGDEYYPSVSLEGELVFTAERAGGKGGEDLWLAYLDGDEWWVENAGGGVNTPGPEFNACLRPDSGALVFSSVRRGDQGGGDLYISERESDGTFGPARALTALNSPGLDFCPSYSSDGKLFWFTSNRTVGRGETGARISLEVLRRDLESAGNGQGDLYWVRGTALED